MAANSENDSSFDPRAVVRRILWVLPVSVAVSVTIALVSTDARELLRLENFTLGFLFVAAALRLTPWLTKTLRLMNWMHFLKHPFTFRQGLRITIMTELGAVVSPTIVGGEPVKAGMLYGKGVSFGESTSLTTMAVVEDLTFYLVGMPIAFVFASAFNVSRLGRVVTANAFSQWWVYAIMGTVVVVLVLIGILIRRTTAMPKFRRRLRSFWTEFKRLYEEMIKRGKNRFALNVLLSAIHWVARYSVVSALAVGLGYEVDVVRVVILQWLVFAVMAFIPTPGATGGAEGVFLLLFSTILSREAIGTVMIGWRFVDYYFVALLAIIVLTGERLLHRVAPAPEGDPEESSAAPPEEEPHQDVTV
ncbi:MAG: lysylphosphatidylglycerol synthase transmembrane domain-containing protein [Spirochaetota bacterium]